MYFKSIFILMISINVSLFSMDDHLGKDPNFLFQDRVMDIVHAGNVDDLHAFLDQNQGKSIDFRHYAFSKSPCEIVNNTKMLLALMQRQQGVMEYQDQLFSLLDNNDNQNLLQFLSNHRGYDLDFIYEKFHKTPLEHVVDRRDVQKVEILNKAGAKLDDGYHSRPLLLVALMNHDVSMQDYLLNPAIDGVDINFRNSEFFWPFEYQSAMRYREDRQALYRLFDRKIYKHCSPQDELSKAAGIGRTQLIDRALSKGARVNDYDSKGDTALNHACSKARILSIAFLIDKGADVNLTDHLKGRSALHWVMRMHKKAKQKGARYMSSSELLPCSFLLMSAGANPSMKDKEGKSIYYWFTRLSVADEERSLLSRTLDLDRSSREQCTRLLEDIYEFQKRELRKYIKQERINIPISCGAKYFWHRPECIRMKNAWVRKDPEFVGVAPDYKDIYQPYIQNGLSLIPDVFSVPATSVLALPTTYSSSAAAAAASSVITTNQ